MDRIVYVTATLLTAGLLALATPAQAVTVDLGGGLVHVEVNPSGQQVQIVVSSTAGAYFTVTCGVFGTKVGCTNPGVLGVEPIICGPVANGVECWGEAVYTGPGGPTVCILDYHPDCVTLAVVQSGTTTCVELRVRSATTGVFETVPLACVTP